VGTRSRNVERQSQLYKISVTYPVDRLQQLQTALPQPSPRIRIPNLSLLTLLHSRSLVRIWGRYLLLLRGRLVDWHRGLGRQVEGRASSWQNLRLSSRSSNYLCFICPMQSEVASSLMFIVLSSLVPDALNVNGKKFMTAFQFVIYSVKPSRPECSINHNPL
jgi:hypothetical protein